VIVIDALAVLNMLPRTSASAAVETFLFDPNQSLHAPQLPGVEPARASVAWHGGGASAAALRDTGPAGNLGSVFCKLFERFRPGRKLM